jgi:dipeptidyl aminopeptidase/acylaminoacyl peptidase
VVEALRSLDGYDIEGKAIGEESDYSEDIIEEEEESDSDENSVKPKKKKKAAKKEQFKFDSDDLDSESYESLPPNFVKTKR